MSTESPKRQLRALGLKPKESWGQNFLADSNALGSIALAARLSATDVCVELGAGLGHLTRALSGTGARVIAVERDRDLASALKAQSIPGVEVIEANAATLQFAAQAGVTDAIVVGNLPYHLTSPILFSVLDQRDTVRRAVFTVQREVALRLAASEGGRAYGLLTVLLGLWFEIEHCRDLAPGLFFPVPKVWSSVIRLERRTVPRAQVENPMRFKQIVKASFGQRRKTLANALRGGQSEALRFDVATALQAAGIDGRRRAETLAIEEFAALERAVAAQPRSDA